MSERPASRDDGNTARAVPADGPFAHLGDSSRSPLSESIAAELDALDKAVAQDIAVRSKFRKLVQRLKTTWLARDISAERAFKEFTDDGLLTQYPGSSSLIARLNADLSRQRIGRSALLEQAVRDYCDKRKQPLQGRFPSFTIAHFVVLSVDEQANRTKVGASSVPSLDWEKLRPALDREIARVWERPFGAVQFRDSLLAVYERLDRRSHTPTGYVRLLDVYREMRTDKAREDEQTKSGGRLSSYFRDEFCADLSKLLRAQMTETLRGPQMDFTSIRHAEEGVSVILPSGDIATYGFMRPKG